MSNKVCISKASTRSRQLQFAMRRLFRSKAFCLLVTIFICGIALINIVHVATVLLSHNTETNIFAEESKQLRNPLATDFSASDSSSEQSRKLLRELLRIKKSVKKELAELESKRSLKFKELNSYTNELSRTKVALSKGISELKRLQLSIISLKAQQDEVEKRNIPLLKSPLVTYDSNVNEMPMVENVSSKYRQLCSMHTCFNYRHCGLTSPAYVEFPSNSMKLSDLNNLKSALRYSSFKLPVNHNNKACIRIGFSVRECEKMNQYNCILIDSHGSQNITSSFYGIVASPSVSQHLYRSGFDVVMPAKAVHLSANIWSHLQPLFPARRKFLLSYAGLPPLGKSSIDHEIFTLLRNFKTDNHLKDKFSIDFTCNSSQTVRVMSDWELCESAKYRFNILKQSTFALIIAPPTFAQQPSTVRFQQRLYESLLCGAIPVILGDVLLPFEELLEWKRAVITLPKQRMTEVHFLLRTIPDIDLIEMKRRGRIIMENHIGTPERQWATLFTVIGRRINLAQPSVKDYPSKTAFVPSDFQPETYHVDNQFVDIDDFLGPVDEPMDSIQFQRNFSSVWTDKSVAQDADAFHRYPFSPWSPVMPTEGQFKKSEFGFRPINHNEGQAGIEFSKSQGGNYPYEQFTMVILTYKREVVLMSTLATLKGLPYLHSVIVVWNSPLPPSKALKWPKLQVPVHVVRGKGNSLNNRFLPFDLIKTEAILSVDDDVQLRQDEIVFGFRVWREQRHRLVGFPARYHQWSKENQKWRYNSNHTCEYSMILTGAAFFHKYYSYLYSIMMPQVIRSYVDRVMNCEDLAMNFLISHITREPPVKVTSRWSFYCQLCTDSLYLDHSHFDERHGCINFLTDVYGYNPLLYSQFRLDSVLFKTRIPSEKRKCFKYV